MYLLHAKKNKNNTLVNFYLASSFLNKNNQRFIVYTTNQKNFIHFFLPCFAQVESVKGQTKKLTKLNVTNRNAQKPIST